MLQSELNGLRAAATPWPYLPFASGQELFPRPEPMFWPCGCLSRKGSSFVWTTTGYHELSGKPRPANKGKYNTSEDSKSLFLQCENQVPFAPMPLQKVLLWSTARTQLQVAGCYQKHAPEPKAPKGLQRVSRQVAATSEAKVLEETSWFL